MTDEIVESLIPLAADLVGAACAGHPEPLWDALIDGENELERIARQIRGLAICRRCPVKAACLAPVDVRHDDGIRGAMILPTISDKDRRAASSVQPGRGGLAQLVAPAPPRCSRNVTLTWDDVSVDPNKSTPRHGASTPKPRGLASLRGAD